MNTKKDPKKNRLLVRAEFLRVGGSGIRFVTSAFVLQKAKEESTRVPPIARYGLTATKKLGNAVIRNRARRRLRALAEECLVPNALPFEFVLVAREAILTKPYAQLKSDLEKALKVLKCHKVNS